MPDVIKKIQQQYPEKRIVVGFQDEARVGQRTTISRIWAPTGHRSRIRADFQHKAVYVFGTIIAALKLASAFIFSRVGTDEMQIHLNEVSKALPHDVHAIIITDRAPWHRSVKTPDNITLVHLPPYSPELNPVEQVWYFLRSNYFSNHVYDTINDLIDFCCDTWNSFAQQTDVIASIGTRRWIQ